MWSPPAEAGPNIFGPPQIQQPPPPPPPPYINKKIPWPEVRYIPAPARIKRSL